MKSNNITATLPHVTDSEFLIALLKVIDHFFEAESRDFVANPKPDHVMVNMVLLLAWVRDFKVERPELRRVK